MREYLEQLLIVLAIGSGIAILAKRVKTSTNQELLDFPSADTLTYLRQNGWSEQIIDSFFRPFFGGVYLDRSLRRAGKTSR